VSAALADPGVEYLQRLGHPGDVICLVAKEGGYDLVVVANQGMSGLKRLVLGSVSDYVAHHCHCPVLITKG